MVRDDETQRPIREAIVQVTPIPFDAKPKLVAMTNIDGEFRLPLITPVGPPFEVRLDITKDGYYPQHGWPILVGRDPLIRLHKRPSPQ